MKFSKRSLPYLMATGLIIICFVFSSVVILRSGDFTNSEQLERRMAAATKILNLSNEVKTLQVLAARLVISGRESTYEEFKACHIRIRELLESMTADSDLTEYQYELKSISSLERQAEEIGRETLHQRYLKRMSAEQAGAVLVTTGLPLVLDLQRRLKVMENQALENWRDSSRSRQDVQGLERATLRYMLLVIVTLTALLIIALLAIRRQQDLIEEEAVVFDVKKSVHNMNDILNEQKILSLEVSQKKDVSVVVKVHPGVSDVLCDRPRLTQALSTLTLLALEASPQGKEIVIAASMKNSEILIEVRDQGRGVLGKNFDQSLYRARKIIEAHGGRLWTEGKENRGSSFFISLPSA